jgi:hypothetical protein
VTEISPEAVTGDVETELEETTTRPEEEDEEDGDQKLSTGY